MTHTTDPSHPENDPPGTHPGEYTHGARWAIAGGLVLAGMALFPLDPVIYDAVRGVGMKLGGDVVRELEALQQFGGVSSVVIVTLVVWLGDAGRRARLLDLLAAFVCTGVVVQVLKMIIGRPRPKFDDPGMVLWPFGRYPMPDADPPGVYHAWEVWEDISSDLWSMPSSHTSAAVVLAVFVGVVYPKLRPLAIALAGIVAVARVLLGAHYPSDVLVGAGAGFLVAHAAVRGGWGVRLLGGGAKRTTAD
ncbi:MAG: phosphatase PAP2 family protein [Phycisphaerales bacterium]